MPGLVAHLRGERHLVPRPERDRSRRRVAAGRDVDEVDAAPLEQPGQRDASARRPSPRPRQPVGGGDAHAAAAAPLGPDRRAPRRPPRGSAGRGSRTSRRTRRAPVGQRREELVQQVAVGGVQLDDVEAGGERALGGARRSAATTRAMSAGVERARGRAVARTARRWGRRRASRRADAATGRAPVQRRVRRRLAAGVRELDAGVAPGGARIARSPRRPPAASFQMPEVLRADPALGLTAVASVITAPAPPTAREPRWTRCQSWGARRPSRGGVLAHRRHPDPVADGDVAEGDRLEEDAHAQYQGAWHGGYSAATPT